MCSGFEVGFELLLLVDVMQALHAYGTAVVLEPVVLVPVVLVSAVLVPVVLVPVVLVPVVLVPMVMVLGELYFNCIIILKRFVFHLVAMHGWGNTWLVYSRFHLFIIKLRLSILYAPDMPVFFPFFEKMDNSRILANFTVVE